MPQQTTMLRPMKGTISLFAILALLFVVNGCTTAETGATRIGQRLQDGLQGQGQIVPNDPTSDSFGQEYR